jgi:protein-S-isoprenylcysteine O-methyltransferase Ste14
MPTYAYFVLGAGWLIWVLPFFLIARASTPPQTRDPRARWGIVLQGIAYSLLWQSAFWQRAVAGSQVFASSCLFAVASLLSWSGARALGKQWRVDAGLNPDHQLVMTGPYRLIRHPIYASMFAVLLGTGVLITPWPMLLTAVLLFIAGTEVRIRIEDALLVQRFGEQFRRYRQTVPAYLPFIR